MSKEQPTEAEYKAVLPPTEEQRQAKYEARERAEKRLLISAIILSGLAATPANVGESSAPVSVKRAVSLADMLIAELARG